MDKVYKVMSVLLKFLPDKWNNKDVQGAVLGTVVVSVLGGAAWYFAPYLQFLWVYLSA